MLLFCASPWWASGQLLKTAWDRGFGGNIWEDCNSVSETADGGFLLGGYTSSTVSGDVTTPPFDGFFPPPDVGDYWIIKTDIDGNKEWDRRYGGNKQDRLWAAEQTADGGYIIGGVSNSDNGPQKTDANRGDEDYWIIKTDAAGTIEWDRTYGGDSIDYFYQLLLTSDGGYLLGGISRSDIGMEKTENHRGDFDLWIIRTDAQGNVIWDRTIGGVGEERINELQEGPDGNYWIGGSTASAADGADVQLAGLGGKDYWLIQLDSLDGGKLQEFRYGGNDEDEIQSFVLTQDGGFLLGGGSRSGVSPQKSEASQWVDYWIVKTDGAGTIEWEQTFGGPELENCYSVKQNAIGNYLVGGFSASGIGPDKTEANRGPIGTEDFWLLYLAPDGTKLWDKTLGGASRDVLENLFQSSDGGYVLAGHSSSLPSGDKTAGNQGLNDFWIIKTLCNVSVEFNDTIVCPEQAILLNASDTNCVQCSWTWEDNSIDSLRQVNPLQNSTYSVTLVDGVGCSWSDDIQINVHTPPTLDLGADPAICANDSLLLEANLPGVDYEWSTGASTESIYIDSAAWYRLEVRDANGCTAVDSVELTVFPLPEVELGNDTAFCAGEEITLDAGNPGANHFWSLSGASGQFFSDIPSAPIQYFVSVIDANNCRTIDSIAVTELYEAPQVQLLTTECDPLNNFYTLRFRLTGGDLASYQVQGLTGMLSGDEFVSDPIPRGQSYNVNVDDGRACGPVVLSGSYDCDCITEAGDLAPSPIVACGLDAQTIVHAGSILDADDILQFILHDGDETTLGTPLLIQDNPLFQFQLPLVYGTTYYVTAVAGNVDNGNVNPLDGCRSQSNGVPITFYENPIATIVAELGTRVTCGTPNIPLSAATSQPLGRLDFFWQVVGSGNITTAADQPIVEVNEEGLYQVIITDLLSGCTATEVLSIESDEGVPDILIATPDLFTCQDTLIELDASASSQGPSFSLLWLGGNIDGATTPRVTVDAPGNYILQILNDDNGCEVMATIQVLADTIGPAIDAGPVGILDCISGEVSLNASIAPDCSNCPFEWSTVEGNLVSGMNSLNPLVNQSGEYELAVRSGDNGCVSRDVVSVILNPEIPQEVVLVANDPQCWGEANGIIRVAQVAGGTQPYEYALNGSDFNPNNEFLNLAPGPYELIIRDGKGCEWDTSVVLSEPLPLQVDLGEDRLVDLGESIRLRGQVNRPVEQWQWSHPEWENCFDCSDIRFTAVSETTIRLVVSDEWGCEAEDQMLLRVRKDREVYIPNAFSADFNGANDYFTLYGGNSVQQIRSLRVFSRWGELLYERENFPANREVLGWDGRMRGREMEPGIYVYVAEIEFIDGEVILYRGDVLLAK